MGKGRSGKLGSPDVMSLAGSNVNPNNKGIATEISSGKKCQNHDGAE